MHTSIRDAKKIIIFVKRRPTGNKYQSILPKKCSKVLEKLRSRKYKFTKISKNKLKTRKVISLPVFNSDNRHTFIKGNMKMNKSCDKILSQTSLKFRANKSVRRKNNFRSIYDSHNKSLFYTNCKIYRCQISSNQDTCCCSCNSDAMFEVMKSLYDCYKKKNCDNCKCILCGHLAQKERQLAKRSEVGFKSKTLSTETVDLSFLKGKNKSEKEKILKDMAMEEKSLPVGKTKSEKELVEKVRKSLGLPPAPKSHSDRKKHREAEAAGIIKPLEGKSRADKEKILREQAALGMLLPEGRTKSEKSIIDKIKAVAPPVSDLTAPSKQIKKAKEAGFLTPTKGKPREEKERILTGLATHGIPLPEVKSPSEKEIVDKISTNLGLPELPKTPAEKEKYQKAYASGIILPLEGKTSAEKEKILRSQAKMGIPLPVGRSPSEKALIEKIKKKVKTEPAEEAIMPPVHVPSEKMKKAKEAGFLTPLKGKTKPQREKILRGLAVQGIPLPDGKTSSEIEVIDNVRTTLGLPPEPKSPIAQRKYKEAVVAGIITPLEGKTKPQKEKIIREQAALGMPLPEGRTKSEKSIIAKIKSVAPPESEIPVSSKKLKEAKDAGFLTPIKGKKQEEKEKILTGLAKLGIPLPEVSSSSEKKIVEKLTNDLGLPPPPTAPAAKEIYKKAYAAGLMTPLEGKSASQKEKILQNQAEMGIHLPVGRTPSEKALIDKVQQKVKAKPAKEVEEIMAPVHVPSEKMKKAKEAGFLTPLKGKTKPQKEKILRGLALQGIPLPDGKTSSEIELIDSVRTTLGLPPEPKSPIAKRKYKEAVVAGIITPLEGKTKPQKEKIIREQAALGMPLPEGRTKSEKSIIAKIKSVAPPQSEIPVSSKKLKEAKDAGFLTPIKGKKQEEKEKILTGLAKLGIPLPEAASSSEKKIVEKLTADLGLPPPPTAPAAKEIYKKAYAAGLMSPLEGKSASQKEKILQNQAEMGIHLPVGRTPSEKALIDKVQQKVKAKPAKEVEDIMAPVHVPSEKMKKAKEAGFLTPLKGKTKPQKEKILRGLALQGIPLPDGKTSSDIEVIDNVRTTLGLPPEPKSSIAKRKYKEAVVAGIITPLEGKTKPQKEKIIREQAALGMPLPEGRTKSEKSIIAKIKSVAPPQSEIPVSSKKLKEAKDAGFLTPIKGKKQEEKEKILTGLAKLGIPLPEAGSSSEKRIVEKLTNDLGLPPPPTAPAAKEIYNKAYAAGLMTPLEGKSASQKEKILQNQAEMGIHLPVGRTPSEKALIDKVQQKVKAKPAKGVEEIMAPVHVPSEKMKKAKEAGFLTPLKGKTKPQKEKILRGLALQGIPLPDGKTSSEIEVIDNVRTALGLPPEPKSSIAKRKYKEAVVAGIITPLEGKTKPQKEKIIREQAALGMPLPEGRTKSEKSIIAKIKSVAPPQTEIPVSSKKLKEAKDAGFLTPIKGKKQEEKEKILTGLAKLGIPLPEAGSSSEKKIVEKLTADLGLPPPPTAPAAKEIYKKAYAAGLMTPLEGKSASQKEKILQNQAEMGIHLPVGRTPSEKALIEKVQKNVKTKPAKEVEEITAPVHVPSEKMKKAKEAGFLTPLKGKTKPQKEKILRGLALQGIPLPDGKTSSEVEVIENVRTTLGLPPEPKSPIAKRKYKEAVVAGIITPLEGKTKPQKEKIIREQAALGMPLPEGRTKSEKSIIAKIKSVAPPQSEIPVSSKKLKEAKDAGFLTPIKGKKQEDKEKILTGLAKLGIPLPEAGSSSEKKIVEKLTNDLGLPPPPTAPAAKEIYKKAYAAGIMTPLEGKSASQKEKILHNQAEMGIHLPVGRTPSEKALIEKVQKNVKAKPAKEVEEIMAPVHVPSEKMKKAKEAGFLTPLKGKTKPQKEKILRGLALQGIPLPDGKTSSEVEVIENVRTTLGLPPEPKSPIAKRKYKEAVVAGIITPLEGKTKPQKEKIIREQAALGMPLPEGRTKSEKSIIAKIKSVAPPQSEIPVSSKKLKEAKDAGFLTPIKGKKQEDKEKILTGLAKLGIPLPEAGSSSEKKIVEKLTNDLGLPPPPTAPAAKEIYKKAYAAGVMTPLEGKSASQKEKILQNQAEMGIHLPVGRTPSEKALIEKVQKNVKAKPAKEVEEIMAPVHVPSEKMKKAKEAGFLTPLKGKTKPQKEKILRGLALQGIPLPDGKTSSEIEVIDNVRTTLGLPPEPKSSIAKRKYKEAVVAGIITPLEGKTKPQKEKIIREQAALGMPLPEGRTKSEKSIIAKIKSVAPPQSEIPVSSKKLKEAKDAGFLTPIKGKKQEEKEKILTGLAKLGIPLPEAGSSSEKRIVEKLTADLGLPPPPTAPAAKEIYKKAYAAGVMTPLEGKSVSQKEKILQNQAEMGIHLPVGRTPSEKALIDKVQQKVKAKPAKGVEEILAPVHVPSEKMKKAKEAGFLTPLKGKTKPQKEKILRGLALQGIPLPDGKTSSEIEVIDNVRTTLGLPPEPKSSIAKRKYKEAVVAGIITPLEGKTKPQKEKIIREQAALGMPLPEGRTKSEKSIIAKIKSVAPPQTEIPVSSKKLKEAKDAGFLTPIKGKKQEEKEKILTGLAKLGIPLPEAGSSSEKKIVEKLTADLGLPPPPTAPAAKEIYKKAYAAGLMTPLEGKSASQKEKILQNQAEMGIHLPVGRTPSEKALIEKVQKNVKTKPAKEVEEITAPVHVPSEKMKKAKEAGFLTPLKGKTKPQKEKILRGLALQGIPLPDGKTSSEVEVIENVRTTLGLPPEPKSPIAKRKYKEAVVAGIITPLEGKTKPQKEKIIREQAALGMPLPEGRTKSEKSIIAKIKSVAPPQSEIPVSSKKLKEAKDAGFLTPIKGKKQEDKEKILTGLAKLGIPLPEAGSSSEKKIVEKLTNDLGLPPPPTAPAAKEIYKKAYAAGIMTPLEGKSASQKEKILHNQAEMGIHLPVGRTPSEKALIEKVQKNVKAKPAKEVEEIMAPVHVPSEKMKKAKEAGFLTPLKGKTKPQKEKILRGLALQGIPLPDGKTSSEVEVIENVRTTLGLPPEPKSPIAKRKYKEAVVAGIITPLEGKTKPQKEKIIREQAALGMPLPEGRTKSEKSIIAKIKSVAPPQSEIPVSSKKLKEAKDAGFLTPIKGKKQEDKEKILTGLAKLGIPLPEAGSSSEKKIVEKLTNDLGLPPPPTAPAAKEIYKKAYAAGVMTPLEGKSASQKEKILQNQAEMGIHLPVGRTPSEKALIEKVQKNVKAKPAKEVEEIMAPVHVPSEKMKKAKEAGFLTPLKGKTKPQKEKILRGLALQGIPLPDGKTSSEIEVIDNVRTTLGLPPEPKSSIAKRKYKEAVVAGIITPLEGKTKPQKEKIIREQAALGMPLPEGRTKSEKSIIAKIKSVAPPQSEIPVSSKKLKEAKDAGFLTPIKGKKQEEKEKILTGLAKLGIPLPEAGSSSEKRIVEKLTADLGLPPPPTAPAAKEIYKKAYAAGLMTPLEGKSASQKEKILQNQAEMGIHLPVGRTPSEKALIEKVQKNVKAKPAKEVEEITAPVHVPSEKMKKAKEAGFLTPLKGKTKPQKEKILRGLALQGIPLPDGKTSSEVEVIENVRTTLGLPPEPKSPIAKRKYKEAVVAGIITPLEGKTKPQKEKIIREQAALGMPLPEGRTKSEKSIIAKIKSVAPPQSEIPVSSKKLKEAKDAGFLTPIKGKKQDEKEKILTGLAKLGIPLPEAGTSSEKKIVEKLTADLGLPPPPTAPAAKEIYKKAYAAGLMTPLEGKSASQKEKILQNQAEMGIHLPVGRTPSEKALIEKVQKNVKAKPAKEVEEIMAPVHVPSEKMKKAKEAGFLTPLKGKTKPQKEKILRGLALQGIPLPDAKTSSEIEVIDNVRTTLGLPPEPKSSIAKQKYKEAVVAGIITPLEGKTKPQKEKIIREQAALGMPLPEGRTKSEKSIIAKIKSVAPPQSEIPVSSKKLKEAKDAGFLTPIKGKKREEKEKILTGLAKLGIPLPEVSSSSEKKIVEKLTNDLGLPPPPTAPAAKEIYRKAYAAGIMTPLEGKSVSEKEKILQNQAEMGIHLPVGRTPSEKALIEKVKKNIKAKPVKEEEEIMAPVHVPSEKMKKAKEAGFVTPLKGKTKPQREKILRGLALQGIPLPDGKTSSEIEVIDNVRKTLGLPSEPKSPIAKQKYKEAVVAGIITPLEGKTKPQKEKIIREQAALGIPLPEGRTTSEKSIIAKIKSVAPPLSEIPISSKKLKQAKDAGFLTPIKGKKREEKEKILTGLAKLGIPLPEAGSSSEKKIVEKLTNDLGLPPPPTAPAAKEIYKKAYAAGLMTPLEGKSVSQKEKILQNQAEMGIHLPVGRSPSEKALIEKVQKNIKAKSAKGEEEIMAPVHVPSEKMKKAKEAGFVTPLKGKTQSQREKILRGLAVQGIPLPDGKTSSEIEVIDNVRTSLGLPPEPKSPIAKRKYKEAVVAGIITPLEGKTKPQKERIIREQAALGMPLPEGRTPSEKSIIAKIKSVAPPQSEIPVSSKKLKQAKDAGFLTPIKGKKREEKEKILTGLAKLGIPLPEAGSSSEQKIVEKLTNDLGLPPPPTAPAAKEIYKKAYAAGIMTPLEGKSVSQKEKILQNQAEMGIHLPVGRTPSEKALIEKVQKNIKAKPAKEEEEIMAPVHVPSEKMKKAKEAGFLTPLKGKTKPQREKILRGLALQGIPLPDGKTSSEIEVIDSVRTTLGLPPEPKSSIAKRKYKEAVVAGIITPLEGKSKPQKEKIIREQAALGMPLPEGRTKSEKSIIAKIKSVAPPQSEIPVSSKKLRKAKAAGLITPLKGKSQGQKEKIIKGLAMHGIPLPDVKTTSEKQIVAKVQKEVGLPPEPEQPLEKENYKRALAAGIITPLEGKTASQKEHVLRKQAELGLTLPEGRTQSEKALIEKVKLSSPKVSDVRIPSQILKKAKAAGFLTPLEGKKKEQKENILKGLAMHGIPLPEGKTISESKLIEKVREDLGLPPEPKKVMEKKNYQKAIISGQIAPLEGKTNSQKENIIRNQVEMGLTVPKGRTASEKALIAKVKASAVAKSLTPLPSQKIRKAKETGYITPIEGKTKGEKEKIIKDMALHGIPLPVAKTKSEKKIMEQVSEELGLPPPPKTQEEAEKLKKAAESGFIVPLQGKSVVQKEKILRNQAAMDLPLPKGRTPSEKSIIKKVQASIGKTRSKVGIKESIQEITKVTKCDKSCGCNTKKIKFKHSYVKIRITSPDVSSICPCPDECLPGVKGGVFMDNGGIKITVGRAMEVAGFSSQERSRNRNQNSSMMLNTINPLYNEKINVEFTTKSQDDSVNNSKNQKKSDRTIVKSFSTLRINSDENFRSVMYSNIYNRFTLTKAKSISSFSSLFFNNESNLSFITPDTSNSSLLSLNDVMSYESIHINNEIPQDRSDTKSKPEYLFCRNSYDTVCVLSDIYLSDITSSMTTNNCKQSETMINNINYDVYALGSTHSRIQEKHWNSHCDLSIPSSIHDDLENNEMKKLVKEIIANELNDHSSSFIVLIPTSSDDASGCSLYNLNSSVCMQVSKTCSFRCPVKNRPYNDQRNTTSGYQYSRYEESSEECSSTPPCKISLYKNSAENDDKQRFWAEAHCHCPTHESGENKSRIISTDTTLDRPCCCRDTGTVRDQMNPIGSPLIKDAGTRASYCNLRPYEMSSMRGHPEANLPKCEPCKCNLKIEIAKQLISSACGNSEEGIKNRSKKIDITIKTDGSRRGSLTTRRKNRTAISPVECNCPDGIYDKKDLTYQSEKPTKKYKNVVCECPKKLPPVDKEDDFRYLRQIRSELTQETSGFKLDIGRKGLSDASFEEILKYYAEQMEGKKKDNCICACDGRKSENKYNICACPKPKVSKTKRFNGVRFHVEGKGSGSKALKGILCFDLYSID